MYGIPETGSLTLEEYWDFLSIDWCAGMGIKNFPAEEFYGCDRYWDQTNRKFTADAIAKATKRMAADRWLGFPIRRNYQGPLQIPYEARPVIGKYIRGIGVETEAYVGSQAITKRDGNNDIIDPIVLTFPISFVDANELIVKYPDDYYMSNCDAYRIHPKCVLISNGTATVEFSRCQLLKPEYFGDYRDDTTRPNYKVDENFLDSVEIYRNYLDTTVGGSLVWYRTREQVAGCSCGRWDCGNCNPAFCAGTSQLACPTVLEQRMGSVQFEPATYSEGTWAKAVFSICRSPDIIEYSVMRGYYERYQEIDQDLIKAIIAIAHNNLAENLCRCDIQRMYYENDIKALEPPVRLGLGRSTWGIYEAEQIIREFDTTKYSSYRGGML